MNINLARALFEVGDIEGASEAIDAAVEANPDWYQPYALRAALLAQQGDIASAREALRQALELAKEPEQRAEIQEQLQNLRQTDS
ncbi:MAG: tetratricopeptide repeat protein [Chloroflexaceae bacterium]|nr:tetratricopeptide repeat protein [Chloroflexaceae bacterium]